MPHILSLAVVTTLAFSFWVQWVEFYKNFAGLFIWFERCSMYKDICHEGVLFWPWREEAREIKWRCSSIEVFFFAVNSLSCARSLRYYSMDHSVEFETFLAEKRKLHSLSLRQSRIRCVSEQDHFLHHIHSLGVSCIIIVSVVRWCWWWWGKWVRADILELLPIITWDWQ